MCGIAGVMLLDGAPAAASSPSRSRPIPRGPHGRAAQEMSALLAHRGPDGEGLLVDGPIALAHRRLAILDLDERAAQPMRSPDGRYALTYNGEVYNFRELRDRLAGRWSFRTTGDTEVVLAAFAAWGPAAFRELHGMYAFALWDRHERALYLARDPMGIKPLFLARRGGAFYFASEARAIVRVLPERPPLDRAAINAYFLRQYIGGEATIHVGVERLPAGTWLRLAGGRRELHRFWTHPTPSPESPSVGKALGELGAAFDRAVERHLVSDVPVGVFLSGGIDSSLIVQAAARRLPGLATFSVGFGDPAIDEIDAARRVAEQFGTQHHELRVSAADALAALPTIVAALDQPLADYAIVPTWLMSRFAAERVKVALGGEGADEVFAGYLPRYLPALLAERLAPWIRPPTVYGPFLARERLRRRLLGDAFLPAADLPTERALRASLDQHAPAGPVNAALFADTRHWLVDDLLVKVDAMGMLASLETRVPYLDRLVVERVAGWSGRTKLGPRTTKIWLRRLARRRLPISIAGRRKHGFTVPVGSWLAGPLRASFLESALDPLMAPWLRRDQVERLYRLHAAGAHRFARPLWGIFIFARWLAAQRAAGAQTQGDAARTRLGV